MITASDARALRKELKIDLIEEKIKSAAPKHNNIVLRVEDFQGQDVEDVIELLGESGFVVDDCEQANQWNISW
jgi:hypothetical protein